VAFLFIMPHIEITFLEPNAEMQEIYIAELSGLNFYGFQEGENDLKAFIDQSYYTDSLLNDFTDKYPCKFSEKIIEEQNWNAEWESGFAPIEVHHFNSESIFAIVRAAFHQYSSNADYELIVTPKMSFGTGHHATTYQMIQEMSLIDFTNKSVIDFGTGTGVLAILAEKMGAKIVHAIDNDDWSINNAKENILANDCDKIILSQLNECYADTKADIILANINLNIILDNLDQILNSSKIGSQILFSGILVEDEEKISSGLTEKGFHIKKISSKNNWLVINTFR